MLVFVQVDGQHNGADASIIVVGIQRIKTLLCAEPGRGHVKPATKVVQGLPHPDWANSLKTLQEGFGVYRRSGSFREALGEPVLTY